MEEEYTEALEYEATMPEEYEDIEEFETKEFPIIDFSEFVKRTELWYQILEGKVGVEAIIKLAKRKRIPRKTRKKTKKTKQKVAKKAKSQKKRTSRTSKSSKKAKK